MGVLCRFNFHVSCKRMRESCETFVFVSVIAKRMKIGLVAIGGDDTVGSVVSYWTSVLCNGNKA